MKAIKEYFFCDADEQISYEDMAWMALVGATAVGGILLAVIL